MRSAHSAAAGCHARIGSVQSFGAGCETPLVVAAGQTGREPRRGFAPDPVIRLGFAGEAGDVRRPSAGPAGVHQPAFSVPGFTALELWNKGLERHESEYEPRRTVAPALNGLTSACSRDSRRHPLENRVGDGVGSHRSGKVSFPLTLRVDHPRPDVQRRPHRRRRSRPASSSRPCRRAARLSRRRRRQRQGGAGPPRFARRATSFPSSSSISSCPSSTGSAVLAEASRGGAGDPRDRPDRPWRHRHGGQRDAGRRGRFRRQAGLDRAAPGIDRERAEARRARGRTRAPEAQPPRARSPSPTSSPGARRWSG